MCQSETQPGMVVRPPPCAQPELSANTVAALLRTDLQAAGLPAGTAHAVLAGALLARVHRTNRAQHTCAKSKLWKDSHFTPQTKGQ